MIFVGFAVLFCVLSAVPAYFSICRNRNPERITLMTLVTNILLFYACCAIHQANIGFLLILAANFAFLIPSIRQLIREPSAWKRFFTPAMTVYFILIPILFATTYSLIFSGWDEYSHWGFSSKLLFETGKMNCEFDQYLEHASYLPGLPVTQVFIHKCMSWNFTEGIILFANSLAILTVFLSFTSSSEARGNITLRLYEMLCGCLLLFFLIYNWIMSVYSEPLLTTLGSLILFRVFTSEESIFDDLELMLLMMLMLLTKTSAMGIIIFAMLFYLIRVWKHRECRSSKLAKWMPVLVCFMPFLVKASWSFLLKYFNTDIVFLPHTPWGEAIVSLCTGKHGYAGEITLKMLCSFVTDADVGIALLLLIVAAVFYCRKGKKKPAEWKMLYFIFMPVFFLTMMFSLLMTYLFIFTRYQAFHLVSFSRYTLTFLGMLLLVQLFLLLKEKNQSIPPSKKFMIGTGIMAIVFIMCAFASRQGKYLFPGAKWRNDADKAHAAYAPVIPPGEKFTVLCRQGNGMKNYIYQYIFLDKFIPTGSFNPVLPEHKDATIFQAKMTPDELLKTLRETTAGYVLLDGMDEDFFKDFRKIFADGDDGYKHLALYRITPEGLKYIPPVK